jgi:hypothetical protein
MEEPKVNYSLTPNEVSLILEGLNELPRKKSDELFMKIRMEAVTQLQPKDKIENASST